MSIQLVEKTPSRTGGMIDFGSCKAEAEWLRSVRGDFVVPPAWRPRSESAPGPLERRDEKTED